MQRKVYYQPLVFSDKSLTQDEQKALNRVFRSLCNLAQKTLDITWQTQVIDYKRKTQITSLINNQIIQTVAQLSSPNTKNEYMNGNVQFYLSSLIDCTMQNPVELFNKVNQMCMQIN